MARLILGVTGSVAAIKTPELAAELGQAGHDVRIVATEPALYFFDPVVGRTVGDRRPPPPRRGRMARDPVTTAAIRSCTSSSATGPTS